MWWMFVGPWWKAWESAWTPAASVAPVTEPVAGSPLLPYYQVLATHGDQAFGVWDRAAGFSLFSANWERVTGLSGEACAGSSYLGRLEARDAERLAGALQSLPTRLDAPLVLEAQTLTLEGQERSGRTLALALWPMSAEGLHGSVMVMARDVEALRQLQRHCQHAEAGRAAAEKGRSSFLSNMSHELRTPLNAIMGFSEMMQGKAFGEVGHPTYEEYVNDIHDSGKHLLGKINDLLDIAAIDQNQVALYEDEVDVAELLADVIEAFSHSAFERNIKLERDVPRQRVVALMDRPKILCVLSHFLSNAIRHSGPGTTITLACRAHRSQGLILSVRDQGEGIAAARLSNIVRALQSSESYFASDAEGIGLGLSLSKELVRHHDGMVSLDSIRHKGTVVSLVLPPERIVSGLGSGNSRRTMHLAKQ